MSTPLAQHTPGKTLIVGLGRTGLSVARFLHSRGVPFAVTDTRDRPPALEALRAQMPEPPLFLGGFAPAAFEAADCLAVSPGVAVREPLIRDAAARGVSVVGDIELFAREVRAPVAAITGSNGKSTVTTLVGAMARRAGLRAAVGGNLGEPALDLLDERAELYVLELSSFQLETTASLAPRVAAVLNLSPDHLDRYPSVEAYAAAKARIFRGAACAVVNRDDERVRAMAAGLAEVVPFTLGAPDEGELGLAQVEGADWLCRGADPIMPVSELGIRGRHNTANALAALAIGAALGLPTEAMLEVLREFRGLPHRTELVGERDGVRWLNDSKGTNPGACIAALEGLAAEQGPGARTVLIAGGDCKGADFAELRDVAARTARAVVLIGRDAPMLERALHGAVPLERASSMEEAVRLAAGRARPGDLVLLSPACASFDMFRDYEHRGQVFCEAVRRLLG
jgi:UDP-N-acetylmuramoylalanine--D-glutamate ligase